MQLKNCAKVLLLLLLFFTGYVNAVGLDCENVRPIWNKIKGKPSVRLEQGSLALISWSPRHVIHGSHCAQAFEAEYQQFGGGRKSWSHWSSLVRCVFVVEDRGRPEYGCSMSLGDIDCGKRLRFRVLLHNIYNSAHPVTPSVHEEVLIQCKEVFDGSNSRVFFIRAPNGNSRSEEQDLVEGRTASMRGSNNNSSSSNNNSNNSRNNNSSIRPTVAAAGRQRAPVPNVPTVNSARIYAPPTQETRAKTSATTTATPTSTTLSISATATSSSTTTTTTTTSTTISARNRQGSGQQQSERSGQDERIVVGTVMLLPRKYAKIEVGKSYDVRHNLKNFAPEQQELSYCSLYSVNEMSDECEVQKDIHRGMEVCLTSPIKAQLPTPNQSKKNRPAKFKMLLDPQCKGTFYSIAAEDNMDCGGDRCHEGNTFIIV